MVANVAVKISLFHCRLMKYQIHKVSFFKSKAGAIKGDIRLRKSVCHEE